MGEWPSSAPLDTPLPIISSKLTFFYLFPLVVDIKMEWSSCGGFLVVGGTQPVESISAVKFYNINGHLRFTLNIPSQVNSAEDTVYMVIFVRVFIFANSQI